MQTSCLRLMGKKLLVALTMEGKFAGEELQGIDEDDDMLSAMARESVERNGIGESADSVWRALSTEHQKLWPTIAHDNPAVSPEELPGVPVDTLFDPANLAGRASDSGAVFVSGQRAESLPRRRRRGKPVVRNKRRCSASVEAIRTFDPRTSVNCPARAAGSCLARPYSGFAAQNLKPRPEAWRNYHLGTVCNCV